MHEWALADGVVSTALKAAEKEGLNKITKIKIKIGEVQQIEIEVFRFALQEVIKPQKALLKDTEIEIGTDKAILKCRNCGHEWAFSDAMKKLSEEESESIHFVPEVAHVYIRCPSCKSPDFELMKGRGVWIESIEGE